MLFILKNKIKNNHKRFVWDEEKLLYGKPYIERIKAVSRKEHLNEKLGFFCYFNCWKPGLSALVHLFHILFGFYFLLQIFKGLI